MMLMNGQSWLLLQKCSAGVEWVCVSTITTLDPFHSSLSCLYSETSSYTSGILDPQSSVHLSVLQHRFTNSNLWNGNQCLRFQLFFLLTKDLQKKSQCQIQRLPKLLIHQIILAMRGFWGHEHRTDWPRPEIGQEKCFMCPNQTSTMFCCIVICCCQCNNKHHKYVCN